MNEVFDCWLEGPNPNPNPRLGRNIDMDISMARQ
jgi:hypothetical protein